MDLQKAVGIVLAGGVGSRLHPLTADRAKPSVPFGGKYRIIDFTLSNCYHSGLRRVLVLTQYKSHSLQLHLRDGWSIYNPGLGEYITAVPPQMRTGDSWYAGTADAVFQNLYLLERSDADHVVILSGDHIYRMDYGAMLQFHCDQRADVTVACMRVPREDARSLGVMEVEPSQRIVAFEEKPEHPQCMPDDEAHALASMGVYVFSRRLLCDVLAADNAAAGSSHDFGKDILPRLIRSQRVMAYRFGGKTGRVTNDSYWRDVGTLDAYYDANMDLLEQEPPLDLYQADWAIRTTERQAPPARTARGARGESAVVDNVLMGAGTVICGATVVHSILGRDVRLEEGAEVFDALLLDEVHVGRGVKLRNCIVDKYVRIPPGETVGYDRARDERRFTISPRGTVVIPRGYTFPQRPAAERAQEPGESSARRARREAALDHPLRRHVAGQAGAESAAADREPQTHDGL